MTMSYAHSANAKIIILICCFALVIGVAAYAYFLSDTNNEVLTKAEIEENIESFHDKELGYTYTSSYIKKFGIGNINSYKINIIEDTLSEQFFKDLPKKNEIAKNVSLLFLEKYYDSIDLSNKEAVTDAVLTCYFTALDDPYAYYRPAPDFDEYMSSLNGDTLVGIGIMVNRETLEIMTVYKDSPAEEAGLLPGDVIYSIDGITANDCSPEELLGKMSGEAGTSVKIGVIRNGQIIETTAVRAVIEEKTVMYEMDKEKIGYIAITSFISTTYDQFTEAVDYCVENGAVALVIDVRYNPGGLLDSVVSVIDYLIPDSEGRVIASYTHSGTTYTYTTTDKHSVDIPIAVICNEYTASAGELFTGAIKDFSNSKVIEGIVVGKTTYGKGVAQTSVMLYDNSGITFTIGQFNPPSGINFNGVGVIPDFEVTESETEDLPYKTAKSEILKLVYTNGDSINTLSAKA